METAYGLSGCQAGVARTQGLDYPT